MAGNDDRNTRCVGDFYGYAVGDGEASTPNLVALSKLDAPKVEPVQIDVKDVTESMTDAGLP